MQNDPVSQQSSEPTIKLMYSWNFWIGVCHDTITWLWGNT